MKVGVLLFNLGGPETLRDVKPFLYRLFSDPEIIRIKFTPLRKSVAYYDCDAAAEKIRRLLRSNRRRISDSPADRRAGARTAEEFKRRGRDVETFVGMCTSHPFLHEAIDNIERAKLDRLVILPLFPQYSVTTTGSGFAALRQLIEKRPAVQEPRCSMGAIVARSSDVYRIVRAGIQRELAKFGESGQSASSLQRPQHSGKLRSKRRSLSGSDEEKRRADHGSSWPQEFRTNCRFRARSVR